MSELLKQVIYSNDYPGKFNGKYFKFYDSPDRDFGKVSDMKDKDLDKEIDNFEFNEDEDVLDREDKYDFEVKVPLTEEDTKRIEELREMGEGLTDEDKQELESLESRLPDETERFTELKGKSDLSEEEKTELTNLETKLVEENKRLKELKDKGEDLTEEEKNELNSLEEKLKDIKFEPPKKPDKAPSEEDKAKPEESKSDKDKGSLLKQPLTEEIINDSDYSDEEKKYLRRFIGQPLGMALKDLANKSKVIGKKASELFGKSEPQKTPEQIANEQAQAKDIAELKSSLVKRELKSQFPDMPDEPEDLQNWEDNLPRRKWDEYRDLERTASKRIDERVDYMVDIRDSHPEINKDRAAADIGRIEKFVLDKAGVDIKEVGLDLTLDENGNNPIIDDILFPNNSPNPDVIMNEFNYLMLQPGALYNAFLEKYADKIINHVRDKARAEGAKQIQKKEDLEEVTPSILHQEGPKLKKTKSEESLTNMSLDDIEAEIEKEISKQ